MIESFSKGHKLEFNPDAHRYFLTLKGEEKRIPLMSVTTAERGFPEPEGLKQWKIKQKMEEYITGKKLRFAGEIGTLCHDLFRKVEAGKEIEVPDIPEIKNVMKLFTEWRKNEGSKDKILAQEEIICSPTLRIGGTLDRLAEREGRTGLFDFKTSTGIYESAFFQLAGYDILLAEWKDIKVDFWEVLRFGKEDTRPETKRISDPGEMNDYRDQFLRNLETYRWMAKYTR